MNTPSQSPVKIATRWLVALTIVALSLTACVPPPLFDRTDAANKLAPWQAAEAPAMADIVIWGGAIVSVRNLPQTTEIEVLAYPLDQKQRPLQRAPSQGRFIVIQDGFVEPADFPTGRYLTVKGKLFGTRESHIDQSQYRFPVVKEAKLHVWPTDYYYHRSRWSFGLGVGF
jgi:outer membrane lipoprotein